MQKKISLRPSFKFFLSLLSFLFIYGFTVVESNKGDSDLKVIIYKGNDFTSYSKEITKSIRKLEYIRKDNFISSLIVEKGTVAKFYRGSHYMSCSFLVIGPWKVPRLDEYDCPCCTKASNGWDDEIASITLEANPGNRVPGIYGNFSTPRKPFPSLTCW